MKDRSFTAVALTLTLLIAPAACRSKGSDEATEPATSATQPVASTEAAATESQKAAAVDELAAKYDPNGKFAFTITELGTGMRTNADGRQVPFRYEFCIPKRPDAIATLATLDPTVIVETRDKGRVGCDDDHLMAHGHTGQPNYLPVLAELAKQDFIARIVLVK